MRWLVLVRHGMGEYTVALKVSRSPQGHVSCTEMRPAMTVGPAPGMSWWTDGRFRLTPANGHRLKSRRTPFEQLHRSEVAYRVPGEHLVNRDLPKYNPSDEGITVELDVDGLLAKPERCELQLLLAPQGQDPVADGEVIADWPVLDGQPSVWLALAETNRAVA
jgi:hypothetical protein